MGETGIITSSYIENTSFPTNQGRSINDNASLNASSFSNHSPAVNLDASILRIPMIGELRNTLVSDIKNSTSSTTRERNTDNTDNSTFHNEVIQSHVKGLPDGWVCKIRYTGSNSTCKVYLDPKSEYEFRSLVDARRYIANNDISHCVVKPKKIKSFEPQTEGRELHSQRGDWLPPGWVINIRTQHGGKCHGMKKKSYYNPSTRLRFYSKVKLFQYLESQKVLIPAIRETSSVETSHLNNSSTPTNHQQSQINSTFKVLTEVSSKSLPNTRRTEITNLQKGAPEFQVPSCIRFEREDCGPSRCHLSDNSPDLENVKIMADMREPVRSSSLPSQGIVVDNTSCTSSYLNCLVGENSKEIRLVNELSPACRAGASSIQATGLGQEWPFDLQTEDLSQFVSSMPQVHMTAPEMAHSQSLRRQDEDLSVLYGNLAIKGNVEMREVAQPIMHTHEQGSTTSMVIEAIKKQHQSSKHVATLKCYQMMHSGRMEQPHEAKSNAFCQLQAETTILNQPAQSNLVTGNFCRQEGPPFVDLVLPHAQQVSTEPTAKQEKGDAILDQPAQSNLFTGSFYRQDEVPCVEPSLTGELQRNTPSHREFSSEQAQLGTSAFAIGNSWSDPYKFAFNNFTSGASQFDDTDKVVQYFE